MIFEGNIGDYSFKDLENNCDQEQGQWEMRELLEGWGWLVTQPFSGRHWWVELRALGKGKGAALGSGLKISQECGDSLY